MATPVTVPELRNRKAGHGEVPLVMITAYDAPSARIADTAGVDIILVGDSAASTVHGQPDTLHITMDQMVSHVAAVAGTQPRPLVVADMPWLSYHLDTAETIRNGARFVRAGAQAVKLEGGLARIPMIRALIETEIPVMGHLGLTPQSVNAFGGYKVQGREASVAARIVEEAIALADAGCFAIVLEAVPNSLAGRITSEVPVPTIGIGAGPACDGQVIVFHDLLGLSGRVPKFVRKYADLEKVARDGVARWASDVREGNYPSDGESYGG